MDWREVRSPEGIEEWQEYYQALSLPEKQRVRSEMIDELDNYWKAYMKMFQTDLFRRRQVDKPSTRRKRRPVRHG